MFCLKQKGAKHHLRLLAGVTLRERRWGDGLLQSSTLTSLTAARRACLSFRSRASYGSGRNCPIPFLSLGLAPGSEDRPESMAELTGDPLGLGAPLHEQVRRAVESVCGRESPVRYGGDGKADAPAHNLNAHSGLPKRVVPGC